VTEPITLSLAWAAPRDRVDLLVERDGCFQVVTGTPAPEALWPGVNSLPPVPDGWRVVLQIAVPADSGRHEVEIGPAGCKVRRRNGFGHWPAAAPL